MHTYSNIQNKTQKKTKKTPLMLQSKTRIHTLMLQLEKPDPLYFRPRNLRVFYLSLP